jgi:CheY-like chemotaxis protein
MVQPVNLNQLVESMMQLLRASISRSVTLFYELAPQSPCAEADVTQLRQILLNLVTNAAEALGDRVGSVTVRTRPIDVDAAFLAKAKPLPLVAPGQYVCLEVEDTGCGMDERIRDKLFDPFFTTKFAGRGLGLAAVHGIVNSHRGGITLHSTMGEGSVFGVLLPACSDEVALPIAKRRSQANEEPRPARILVVDDEKAVRSMTRVALESLGHEVLEADSGRQACAVFSRHKSRIDLVLLDLTMPEMNGEQTLRALQEIDPNVRALIATGYGEEDVREQFQSDQLAGFLAKPFSREELLKTVSAALELSPWPQR